MEAEERGARGKSAPAPDKVQISTSHLRKKVHTGHLHRRLGGKAGKKLGALEKRFHLQPGGENVSASSDGKKSLQDPGSPVIIVSIFYLIFFHINDSGILIFFQVHNGFLFYYRSKFCVWWSVHKICTSRDFIATLSLSVYLSIFVSIDMYVSLYIKFCYIFSSKLKLLKDNCKGMSFVSFSENNVNKTS